MQNLTIKSHQKGKIYANPHLFILNKGLNSGKPQKEPFTNSFVILFESEQDLEDLYFVAYSLWISKFWHRHLVGSVIPFLRLNNFKTEFFIKSKMMMEEHEAHVKHVAALKLLEISEKRFRENMILVNGMRRVIVHRYCNR